ncbi:MAG: helix-turn-helix transcriptional regulator [Acidobacteria bacterium]|nr:helix-turn-helix transcriptional regulator [Acidobacteriota bacterium]
MAQKNTSITFGEQLKRLEIDGFILTETFHAPRLVLSRHDHECANINFTIKGSFREIFGSRLQEATPSSILIKPAGEHHANQYGGDGALGFTIEVLPHKLEVIRRFSKLFDSPAHIRHPLLSALAKKIYKEFRMMNSPASELMIEGLILEMMAESTRREIKVSSSVTPPHWLSEARDFIRASFAEQMSLSKVAESVGVNPAHLARMFRRYYGCTVGEYVRRHQMEYAARQLTETRRSLAEIGASAGFYDQSHFTNAFKLYFKITPAEFRVSNTQFCYKKS